METEKKNCLEKVHSVKNKESLHFPFLPEENLKTKLQNNVKKIHIHTYLTNAGCIWGVKLRKFACISFHRLLGELQRIYSAITQMPEKRNTKRPCSREGYVLEGMPHYTGKLFDLHKPASHPLLFIPQLPCLGNNSSVQR